MKKINILVVNLILLIHLLYGEPIKDYSYAETNWHVEKDECYGKYDPLLDRQIYPKKPILLKKIYSEGTLHMSVPCFKGKLNGVEKTYYKNGNIQAEIPLKDNIKDGKCIFYHEDASVSQIEFIKDGYLEGNTTYYFPDGTVHGKKEYSHGVWVGLHYILKKNLQGKKQLRYEGHFINGKKEGFFLWSQGAIFTGFTNIDYYKKGKYDSSLSIFRRSKKHLAINIHHKKLINREVIQKKEKCVFKWYKKRGELFLKYGNTQRQKDLKEACFSEYF